MSTIRYLTPGGASGTQTASSGFGADATGHRQYSATAPGYVDATAPDDLQGQGWVLVGPSGTTAQRPGIGSVARGSVYFDTTLNKLIVADSVGWRDAASGAVV